MTTQATFTRLRSGSWGVRLVGHASAGDSVTVSRRDGTTSTVTLGREIWTDGRVHLFALAGASGSSSSARQRRPRIRESSKTCWETGGTCYSIDGSPYCEECGEHMYR